MKTLTSIALVLLYYCTLAQEIGINKKRIFKELTNIEKESNQSVKLTLNVHNVYHINLLTSSLKYILRQDSGRYVISAKGNVSKFYDYKNNKLSFHINSPVIIERLKNSNIELDENVSFISLHDKLTSISDMIIYDKANKTFIDENSKIYKNIYELIENRYGSLEKYFEISNQVVLTRQFLEQNTPSTNEELSAFLKFNYFFHSIYNPKDTLKTLDFFVDEISLVINLNKNEEELIKEKVIKKFRSPFKLNSKPSKICISIYNYDITDNLLEVITTEKYIQLYKYIENKRELNNTIHNRITYDFKNLKSQGLIPEQYKSPNEFINSAFKY